MAFNFYNPTKLNFGAGKLETVGEEVKKYGSSCLLVTTPNSEDVLRPLYDRVKAILDKAGVRWVHFDEVVPNPDVKGIAKAIQIVKDEKLEVILGVGGGSSLDTAKSIALFWESDSIDWSEMFQTYSSPFEDYDLPGSSVLPVIAVPTTAGTGSETTVAAVITDSKTHHKASMNDTSLMPKFAVLDPQLTTGLPPHVTSTTGMDALCHAVESYTNNTYNSKLEKKLCEDAVRLIYHNLYEAYCDGDNIEARQNMQKAAFYAGRAFTRGCVGYVHALGHTLGGLYGTPHGLAMSVILPHVMRQFGPAAHERLARLAEVCGMTGKNDAEKAEAFLTWIEQLKAKMNIPEHLDVIKGEDIPQIIKWASKEANPLYPVPVIWGKEDFEKCIASIRG